MRKFKIFLTPRAIEELQKAIDYYNNCQSGLGKRFNADFKQQLNSIKARPFTRAIRYDDIRLAVFEKFPYAIHFCIEDDFIIIHGVLSMLQDPQSAWISRK